MSIKQKIKHIAASLEYGRVNLISLFIPFWAFLLVSSVSVSLFSLNLMPMFDGGLGFSILITAVVCVCIEIFIILRNQKVQKRTAALLEDVVELTANSITADALFVKGRRTPLYKLCVGFNFDGNKMILYSGHSAHADKPKGGGYDSVYESYRDRTIRILYSQKHNQVLILKDDAPSFERVA